MISGCYANVVSNFVNSIFVSFVCVCVCVCVCVSVSVYVYIYVYVVKYICGLVLLLIN